MYYISTWVWVNIDRKRIEKLAGAFTTVFSNWLAMENWGKGTSNERRER